MVDFLLKYCCAVVAMGIGSISTSIMLILLLLLCYYYLDEMTSIAIAEEWLSLFYAGLAISVLGLVGYGFLGCKNNKQKECAAAARFHSWLISMNRDLHVNETDTIVIAMYALADKHSTYDVSATWDDTWDRYGARAESNNPRRTASHFHDFVDSCSIHNLGDKGLDAGLLELGQYGVPGISTQALFKNMNIHGVYTIYDLLLKFLEGTGCKIDSDCTSRLSDST